MDRFVLTIDGPAGSGKSTIAKLLSRREGFIHINSGMFYRAIAFIFGEDVSEEKLLNLKFSFDVKDGEMVLVYNGKLLNEKLQREEVGKIASKIAKKSFVRDFVNKLIRDTAKSGRFVIDGRDCGSVIFPDAQVKVFLDASLEERAKRRATQTNEDLDRIKEEIRKRDEQDKNRDIAPLIVPDGAEVIDTTDLSIEDVYKRIVQLLEGFKE
ncbi:(d)CMP kinase [Hippea alviniae]|uniref:(d)CMP kinase n=1 Tax=Hippea alviniae TaxID=1279027 RepID=UPI0003B2F160|nr:(d)CMP kinase [Hippea alviniae]